MIKMEITKTLGKPERQLITNFWATYTLGKMHNQKKKPLMQHVKQGKQLKFHHTRIPYKPKHARNTTTEKII